MSDQTPEPTDTRPGHLTHICRLCGSVEKGEAMPRSAALEFLARHAADTQNIPDLSQSNSLNTLRQHDCGRGNIGLMELAGWEVDG